MACVIADETVNKNISASLITSIVFFGDKIKFLDFLKLRISFGGFFILFG